MKKLFLIIGAPGSGKTTDAEKIAANRADIAVHYSTGELLRSESASGSERGKLIESFTSKGQLVPLHIVVQTIVHAITNAPKDVILIDGYPRSVEQMNELDSVLSMKDDVKLTSVIEVEVSEAVAKDRVLGRARGDDDNAEVFKNRMQVYLEPLPEIEKFYTHKKILHKINGERSIDEIVSEMQKYIESKI
ncbi:adenylate kinase [Helicobacter sp. 11S02629-2]|uniref:adenylate kinase n=1 Tax=Helicobacter sp. 11S02629-2 TaxID=1476195 RepID=UPI000BA797C8|nr:adenylate kinase [Helicobacter sp. 11S02629-2]PAF45876.1 adenylate kinase [Helicobacter sp. 11S02629-2]